MTTSLWLMDNGNFAVRDSIYDTQPDTATWTRLARYDETMYPVIHQKLCDNVKNATWNGTQLIIDGNVEIDGAWIVARQAELDTAQQISTDTKSLRDYAVLAQAHSKTIKALFLAITNADVASDNTATRFAAIATIIEDTAITATAFKNRFNAAFTAESGVSLAGLDLTALLLLTAAQKQRYINFARNFTVHYGLMLLWST